MPFYSIAFVLALASAGFFYKAGVDETGSGVPWGGLSVVISAIVILVFNGGAVLELAAQIALMIGIALFRVWRDPQ